MEQQQQVPTSLDELLLRIEALTLKIFPPGLHAKQSNNTQVKQHRHLHDDQPDEEDEDLDQPEFEYLTRQPSCMKNFLFVFEI
jgi:hypothetical protein